MADYFRSSLSDGRSPSPSAPRTPLTPTTPSLRSNIALTAKVNSVLSASYADLEIKDALSLLDERDIKNTAETRRRLRLDIQKDVIDTNGTVITEFGHVAEQLQRIGATLASLTANYAEMKRHVTLANQETAPVLEEAKDLLERKADGEKKSRLLEAFRAHFLLSEDDLATLTSTAEPVGANFFSVLERAKTIQRDCTVLLTDEAHQRLGTEIHEKTSQNMDRAFEKLHRWTTREFKTLNLENPSLNASMRTALKVLAERPSLFQACLDAFAESREKTLADLFYTALTGYGADGREGAKGGGKAIEEEASDAMRYVGDMAAWVHSATVSEREALETLFLDEGEEISRNITRGREIEVEYDSDSDGDGDISPGTQKSYTEKKKEEETIFDGRKALNQLVDRDISAATRTLRQRTEAVLSSIEEPMLSYKISHLLGFYHVTFMKLFGGPESDSILVSTMLELQKKAFERFEKLARDQFDTLREAQEAESDVQLDNGLGVPAWLHAAMEQLREVFRTFDSSLAIATATESEQGREMTRIVDVAYNPYLKLFNEAREILKDESGKNGIIFGLNCLAAVRQCLRSSEAVMRNASSTQRKAVEWGEIEYEEVGHEIEEARDQLGLWVEKYLARGSGCEALLDLVRLDECRPGALKSAEDLEREEAFSPEKLEESSQKLDDFLPSALMDVMDELRQLEDEGVKRDAVEEAVEKFCSDFERLEDVLGEMSVEEEDKKEEGYDSEDEMAKGRRRYFPRTSGEIRVLLS